MRRRGHDAVTLGLLAGVAGLMAACSAVSNNAAEPSPNPADATTIDQVVDTPVATEPAPVVAPPAGTEPTSTDRERATSTTAISTATSTPIVLPMIECATPAGDSMRVHNDLERVVLFAPATVDQPSPVLVLFHGFGGVHDQFAANTGLLTEAPAAGVHLAAPVGLGSPVSWEFPGGSNDDVGFISGLIDDLAADPCIDPDRIWLAGYSAGAGFVGTFACDAWERLDGIVMNAAVPPPQCAGLAGFDVIVAHGTADIVVDYDGLTMGEGDGAFTLPSSPDLTAEWARQLDCAASTELVAGALTQQRWHDCGAERNTVDMLTYANGGHRWPGRDAVGGEGLVVADPDLTCVVLAAIAGADDAVAAC